MFSNDVVSTSVSEGFSAGERLRIRLMAITKESMALLTGSKQKQNFDTHHTEYCVALSLLLRRKELQSRGELLHFLMAENISMQLSGMTVEDAHQFHILQDP